MTLQHFRSGKIASVALALFALPAAAEPGLSPEPIYVRTMTVEAPEATMARQFFGRVVARDTVDLAFEVGGTLAMLEAPEGTPAAAGATLAALDLGAFERAVERAELELERATRDLERAETLATRNVASEVTAENARTARDLAEVQLRDARAALADATLIAPFDALIADRLASNHTIVEPGQPIVRLHDMSEIRVEVDLPERLLRRVADPAAVSFVALQPGEGRALPLAFREFRVETGPVGQSYTLSLALVGAERPALLPGQPMIVRAAVTNPDHAMTVPPSAIATLPEGEQVVVAVEARETGLVARHIAVDVTSPTGTALQVEGLAPNTEIVAVGAHTIPDGAPLARYAGLVRGAE